MKIHFIAIFIKTPAGNASMFWGLPLFLPMLLQNTDTTDATDITDI